MMWVIEIKARRLQRNDLVESNNIFLKPPWANGSEWETHKRLTCGETHYGTAVFACPHLLVSGGSGIRRHDDNACSQGMLRYRQLVSIWKLI